MSHDPDHELARLAAIVASSRDAIYSLDLEGNIATWNAAAETLFGYRADEVVGRPIDVLIPEEGRAEEAEVLARVREGESVVQIDTERVASVVSRKS